MESFFNELREILHDCEITVVSWKAEWGQRQWEVNLLHGNPINISDNHLIFKQAVKFLATKHGYVANFMARPNSDVVGSSCHIHLSMHNRDGKSIFYDKAMPNCFSASGQYAVNGILKYASEFSAMYASNINSYRRLATNNFCGAILSWGFDNRISTCRILGSDTSSSRIEFRIPGADSNPYLAIAGLLASARKGMEEQQLPLIEENKIDRQIHEYQALPFSLESATKLFRDSVASKNEFGISFVNYYSTYLENEINKFNNVVSEWEVKRYYDI
jgi:glutamine synthetase